jgi:succinate dehydrogenase/fumarate reductase flavoprotein subunit
MSANLTRRSFLASSAALGGLAAGLAGKAEAKSAVPSKWDFEADVVVVGAGASGIPAAIRAAEAGQKVLIVDANYDIGGHAIISQGNTLLGGGTALQKKYGIKDDPETFFKDLTDWSVTLPNGFADYRYNDRSLQRLIADNSVPTYDWLVKIGVPFLDKKPDNAGAYGAGCSAPREHHFSWTKGACAEAPAGKSGTVLMRALENAAIKAGVQFLMNFYMDELVTDDKGRVIGLLAHRTPKVLPDGKELQAFKPDNKIECKQQKIAVHAKKALVLATAGYTDNVAFRRAIDPRLTAEFGTAAVEYSPQDGSGTLAAMKLGAALWGTTNAYTERSISLTRGAVVGVRDTYLRWSPQSPLFPLIKHAGVSIRNWQDAIVVNWCGKRFFEETSCAGDKFNKDSAKLTSYGTSNSTRGLMNGTNGAFFKDKDTNPYVQGNWRNIERTRYNPINFIPAALQINEGSHAPDWSSGPSWAIFDSEAVKRERMHTDEQNVDPQYFFQADTLEELAKKINTNPWMSHKMDGKQLAETVKRYNSFVDQGKDEDFDKPTPKFKIEKAPFYAAWTSVTLHDCYCGLHVDDHDRVLTWEGKPIDGLYAVGEVTGGSSMHGLSRGLIQGYVFGKNFKA